jgi:hypothetical protein
VRLVQARGGSLRGHRLHLRPPPRSLTGVRRVIRLYSAARLLPIPQVVRKRGGVKGAGWRKGTEGQTGSEVEEGALSAASGPLSLCRSPRLRGCVCATPFAQQLEIGISPPRKSSPPRARARCPAEEGRTRCNVGAALPLLDVANERIQEQPAVWPLYPSPFIVCERQREREGGREGGRKGERLPSTVRESCAHMADCRTCTLHACTYTGCLRERGASSVIGGARRSSMLRCIGVIQGNCARKTTRGKFVKS